MTRITVDRDIALKIRASGDEVELCDPEGKTIGKFHVPADPEFYKSIKIPFGDEELQRLRQQRDGRTLEEIMADLRGKA